MIFSLLFAVAAFSAPVDSTVKIYIEVAGPNGPTYGFGSGVYIHNGILVTNNHVVAMADKVFIKEPNSFNLKRGEVIKYGPEWDLALVKVQSPSKHLVAKISTSTSVMEGAMRVVGNSAEGDFVHDTVNLVGSYPFPTPFGMPLLGYLLDGKHITSGFSGSGVFDKKGEVVAIIKACSVVKEFQCMAIRAEDVWTFLRRQ